MEGSVGLRYTVLLHLCLLIVLFIMKQAPSFQIQDLFLCMVI